MPDAQPSNSARINAVTTRLTLNGSSLSVLTVVGELDICTVADLAAVSRPAAAGAGGGLIVDLSQVRFMSSSAITELVRTFERLPRGAGMALVATAGVVVRPVQLSGIDQLMTLFENIGSAAAHLADRTNAMEHSIPGPEET